MTFIRGLPGKSTIEALDHEDAICHIFLQDGLRSRQPRQAVEPSAQRRQRRRWTQFSQRQARTEAESPSTHGGNPSHRHGGENAGKMVGKSPKPWRFLGKSAMVI